MQLSIENKQPTPCLIVRPPRVPYNNILQIQKNLWSAVASSNPNCPSAIVIVEHNPVITLGTATLRSSLPSDPAVLEKLGIELVKIDRGGDATYHGPGQVVAYPIVDVRKVAGDVHSFLRLLEEAVIDTISEYGLSGERRGLAGVWVNGGKICSIGIAVRKWVSYHGLALNVCPDMSHFALIKPCGLDPAQITSMERLLGRPVDFNEVKEKLVNNICHRLNLYPMAKDRASSALSDLISDKEPGSCQAA